MSHQPSKSNEEIIKEFEERFVVDGPDCRIVASYDKDDAEFASWRDYVMKNWLLEQLAAKDAETKKAVAEERMRIRKQSNWK